MVKQRHSGGQAEDSSRNSADTQPDAKRIYYLYRYLLGCLAMERRPNQAYNAAKTAERVGDKDLRKLFPALFETDQATEGAFEKDTDKNSRAGTEKDTQKAWREAAKKYSKARKLQLAM